MATYSSDLTDIDLCEDDASMQQIGSGNIALGVGVDFRIQGTNAVDMKISGAQTKGAMSNKIGVITNDATNHFFVWCQAATAGAMDLKANGGKQICIGTSINDYVAYYVDGNDTNLEGGYKVYPVAYNNAEARPDTLVVGSPLTNPDHVGAVMKNTGVNVKSNNFSVDGIRHGAGIVYVEGAGGTFNLAANWSNDNARKWGLLVPIEGGTALRGQLTIGRNSAGVPTQAEFTDSNKLVAFSDTEFTNTDFTRVNIDHPATVVNLTSINFLAIGTNNRGQINALDASSTVNMTGCNFTGINTTTLAAGCTMNNCVWNRADQITQNGATIFSGSIVASTNASAVVANNLGLITKVNFVGDGTGHAVDLGTITTSGSVNWDNTFDATTYATSSGTTGNEVILVNYTDTGAPLTISVSATGNAPTVMNTGAGTVVIASSTSLTLVGLQNPSEVRIYESGTINEVAGLETVTTGVFNTNISIPSVDIVIVALAYEIIRINAVDTTVDVSLPIQQRFDRNYRND